MLTRLLNQVGLVPKELWRDRVLHEAQHTADPVHLIRLFGIHSCTAVKHVNAAHPDKALPGTQRPARPAELPSVERPRFQAAS